MGGDVNGNFGGGGRKTVNIDTSEETSDTNVDENEVVEAVHVLPPPMASSASRSGGTTPKSASRYEVFLYNSTKNRIVHFLQKAKKITQEKKSVPGTDFQGLSVGIFLLQTFAPETFNCERA